MSTDFSENSDYDKKKCCCDFCNYKCWKKHIKKHLNIKVHKINKVSTMLTKSEHLFNDIIKHKNWQWLTQKRQKIFMYKFFYFCQYGKICTFLSICFFPKCFYFLYYKKTLEFYYIPCIFFLNIPFERKFTIR